MKQIIRLTESELMEIINSSVKRMLREDVLGNDWNVNDEVLNNYEAFEDDENDPLSFVKDYEGFEDEHNWSGVGEADIDPSYYEDPSWDKDREDGYLSDGDLYRGW